MEMIDTTGQPRRDEEIVRARDVILKRLTSPAKSLGDPELFLEFLTIKEALDELLARRRAERKT